MKIKIAIIGAITSVLMFTACDHAGHEHSHHQDHDYGHLHDEESAHEHEDGVIHFSAEQAKMAGVQTEIVQVGTFAEVIRVSGQVSTAQGDESAIVARTNGVINFMRDHLSEGSEVRQGEVLARVSAEGIAGGDQIAQNALVLENARADYERAQRLIVDSIISQKDFERIRTAYESALLAVKAGNTSNNGAPVTSPLKGFVKQVLVTQGEYVEAGQMIATVTKSCNLQLRAEVPEKHFAKLQQVRSANFKMGYDNVARSLDEMGGHLVAVGKSADEGSAYIPVTFEFANTGNVVPGSFADIWLIMKERSAVLTIPETALSEAQGVFYAFIQHDDDEEDYEKREVKLGASDGIRVEILSGLTEGEKVVTSGVIQIKMAGAAGVIPEAHNHSH